MQMIGRSGLLPNRLYPRSWEIIVGRKFLQQLVKHTACGMTSILHVLLQLKCAVHAMQPRAVLYALR